MLHHSDKRSENGKADLDAEAHIRRLEQQLAAAQATINALIVEKTERAGDVQLVTHSEALQQLRERVKELTLLHYTARLLDGRRMELRELLQTVVDLIPKAWQYPDIAAASIRYGDLQVATPAFSSTPWMQRAPFSVPGGAAGVVEISYLEERAQAAEGPFLAEERAALDALTGMLQAELQRRQASKALEESETRYRDLFEAMAQGVIYQDEAGRVIDMNPAARRMLGIEQMDLDTVAIGDADLKLVHEDSSPFSLEERPGRKAMRTGKPVHDLVIGIYVAPEDSYRWVIVNAIPQFRPGETEPYQVCTTLEDITERKRADERRAQLAALVESSRDAIISVDFEGIVHNWNRGAQRIFGYAPEEIIGQPVSVLLPPEYRHEQQQVTQRVQQGQFVENYGAIRLTKDGRRVFIDFSISPILDSTGRRVGLAAIGRDVTAQKRAEARLRFQAQLLDSVNESVIACDLQERVIYWGKGAEALYGYTRQEALGRTLHELKLLPEKLTPAARAEQLRDVFTQGYWHAVLHQRRQDGSRFWARISLSPVRDRNEKPIGIIGIDRDISAQRQHEQEMEALSAVADALRAAQSPQEISAATFEMLQRYLQIEGCAVAVLESDSDHYRLVYATGAYKVYEDRLVALDLDLTGDVIREGKPYVTEELGAAYSELAQPLPEAFAAACIPLVASSSALGAIWVGRAEPLNETELRLLSSIADLLASALQRALFFERLEEQAVRVQRVLDTVDDGLVLLDAEQRVILASAAAVEHLAALGAPGMDETTRRGLVGQRITALGDRPLEALLQMAPVTEQIVQTKGAPRMEFNVAVQPVMEKEQESGWVMVLRDVTEARRTQELVHQQERLAAVGQLAAGIAHDFNNVMSAIVLYAQILQRRDDLSEQERRRLDVIYRQANHAIELIKQILDFSRRSVMERSAIDLAPFFKEAFRLFNHTLPESIRLSLQYDESEYVVLADPTRLQQAITNLAINARDAMPEGGSFVVHLSRLHLQAGDTPPAPDMAPGAWMQIAVSDSGSGMSPEMLQHVFEPFYTTKRPGKGTGLGLAQVYGIIRQHDGFITVDSVLGQGTTFTIYLPLLDDNKSSIETPVPAFSAAAPAAREATVLVVEDQEWARTAVVDTLSALGYNVLAARDGQEALALFEERGDEIALVLSDMVMPEMGGLKLFEQIRSNYPHVKLIIMSGYPLDKDGRSLLEQGVVAWINKPFSVNDLAQKVAEALA